MWPVAARCASLTWLRSRHAFSQRLKEARKPLIIVGMSALKSSGLLKDVRSLAKSMCVACPAARPPHRSLPLSPNLVTPSWNGINVLHTAAARVGGLDVGFVPGPDASDKDGA